MLMPRQCDSHNAHNDDGEHHHECDKPKRRFDIHRKRHDGCTHHDEGRAQKQTKPNIDTRLRLIDITCHAIDEGGGTDLIHLCIGKLLDMGKDTRA